MKSEGGFTLFEVMTVLLIMGIIISISPVSSSFYNHSCYEKTITEIVVEMRRFRMKAICENVTYNFRIYRTDDIYINDSDSKSDYIFYYEDDDNNAIVVHHGKYPAEYRLYKNLERVIVDDNSFDSISFTGRGTADTGTIGLETLDGKFQQIVVSQLGRIRIEK